MYRQVGYSVHDFCAGKNSNLIEFYSRRIHHDQDNSTSCPVKGNYLYTKMADDLLRTGKRVHLLYLAAGVN